MRVTRTWRIWALGLGLCAGLGLWGWSASEVLAYSQPSGLTGHDYSAVCPPRPADAPEGATVSEVALVTIAQELADSCARREQLAEQQHTDSASVTKRLGEQLTVGIAGEPTVKVANLAEQPTGGTVELSTGAKETVAGDAQAIHDDMWYLIGALFAVAVGFVLYSEIRPRG